MFTNKTGHETQLDAETDRVLTYLATQKIDSTEYAKALDHVVKLQKMKEDEKPSKLSPDSMLLAATNIVGILLILGYEHSHVVTSKATSFVRQAR
jgi:hypothetical protein